MVVALGEGWIARCGLRQRDGRVLLAHPALLVLELGPALHYCCSVLLTGADNAKQRPAASRPGEPDLITQAELAAVRNGSAAQTLRSTTSGNALKPASPSSSAP